MKAHRLLLRVYGERVDGQWSLINLDFSLAAQGDTLEEARAHLDSQLRHYLYEALAGEDREHAQALLLRRAPAKYWLKYWLEVLRGKWTSSPNGSEQAFRQPIPLIPA